MCLGSLLVSLLSELLEHFGWVTQEACLLKFRLDIAFAAGPRVGAQRSTWLGWHKPLAGIELARGAVRGWPSARVLAASGSEGCLLVLRAVVTLSVVLDVSFHLYQFRWRNSQAGWRKFLLDELSSYFSFDWPFGPLSIVPFFLNRASCCSWSRHLDIRVTHHRLMLNNLQAHYFLVNLIVNKDLFMVCLCWDVLWIDQFECGGLEK